MVSSRKNLGSPSAVSPATTRLASTSSLEQLEDVFACRILAIDDRFDRVEIGATGEYAELAEDRLLMRLKQCVRPVDRFA